MHFLNLNSKINRLHEICLRNAYEDHQVSLEKLLEMDNSASVHYKNLQCLDIELVSLKGSQ